MEEVRTGEKEIAVAGQGAVAPQGRLDAALEERPALGVDQGVRGLDAGGDLGGDDADGSGEQQQKQQADSPRRVFVVHGDLVPVFGLTRGS